MAISNKEYNIKGAHGCRCKYCWNGKVQKLPWMNNSRLFIKHDTEKEIEISWDVQEFEIITDFEYTLEEDYQAFLDMQKEQVYESLTDEQYEEYVSDWSQFTEEHFKIHEETERIAREQAKEK